MAAVRATALCILRGTKQRQCGQATELFKPLTLSKCISHHMNAGCLGALHLQQPRLYDPRQSGGGGEFRERMHRSATVEVEVELTA